MEFKLDVRKVIATTQRLAEMDPQDAAVDATVQELKESIALLTSEVEKPAGEANSHGAPSRKDDVDRLKHQIDTLHSAASKPAKNYQRIVSICAGLKRAIQAAERPQYASLQPRIAKIVEHVAGVFSEVDTVEDLDKPLEAIEKAVHSLYGDQSKNGTFYFERRNKGHHGDSAAK